MVVGQRKVPSRNWLPCECQNMWQNGVEKSGGNSTPVIYKTN